MQFAKHRDDSGQDWPPASTAAWARSSPSRIQRSTRALCQVLDFVWIDMEHNALLARDRAGSTLMATKGSDTTALVRSSLERPGLIKPVLDIGVCRESSFP